MIDLSWQRDNPEAFLPAKLSLKSNSLLALSQISNDVLIVGIVEVEEAMIIHTLVNHEGDVY